MSDGNGATPVLEVEDIHTYYGSIEALKGISLTVNEGEIVTLIGANGAGKSTLMMTIFGNPRAREGRILYRGQDITHLPTHEIARLRISACQSRSPMAGSSISPKTTSTMASISSSLFGT